MTIKTVTYSQSKETMYGYGLKRWDKASVEIELTESDNPENAFSMAKQLVDEQLSKIIHQKDEMKGTQVRDVLSEDQEEKIKQEYSEVETKLNQFEYQEDAIEYLNTTTFKHFIPAKAIANSKPIKNK